MGDSPTKEIPIKRLDIKAVKLTAFFLLIRLLYGRFAREISERRD